VLREVQVLPIGEAAPPEYVQLVAAKYTSLYDMMLTDSLVSWTSDEDIPTYAEQPVTMMLAYLSASALGLPESKVAELRQAGALHLPPAEGGPSHAERQLRRQLARAYVPYPAQSDYF